MAFGVKPLFGLLDRAARGFQNLGCPLDLRLQQTWPKADWTTRHRNRRYFILKVGELPESSGPASSFQQGIHCRCADLTIIGLTPSAWPFGLAVHAPRPAPRRDSQANIITLLRTPLAWPRRF